MPTTDQNADAISTCLPAAEGIDRKPVNAYSRQESDAASSVMVKSGVLQLLQKQLLWHAQYRSSGPQLRDQLGAVLTPGK